jgi:hypothetical protein
VEHASKARRIRYSRHFFPMAVKDLRRMAFSGLLTGDGADVEGELVEDDGQASGELLAGPGQEGLVTDASEENSRPGVVGLGWKLDEAEGYSSEVEVYEWRRRRALLDSLGEVQAGRRLSRRVVGIWAYQQSEQGGGA